MLAALLECDKVINNETALPLDASYVVPQIHLMDGVVLSGKTPLKEVRTIGTMYFLAGTGALLTGALSVGCLLTSKYATENSSQR